MGQVHNREKVLRRLWGALREPLGDKWQRAGFRWTIYFLGLGFLNAAVFAAVNYLEGMGLQFPRLDMDWWDVSNFLNTVFIAQVTMSGLSIPSVLLIISQKDKIFLLNADEVYIYLNKSKKTLINDYFDYIFILFSLIVIAYIGLAKNLSAVIVFNFLVCLLVELILFRDIYNKFIGNNIGKIIDRVLEEIRNDGIANPSPVIRLIEGISGSIISTGTSEKEKRTFILMLTSIIETLGTRRITENNKRILSAMITTLYKDKVYHYILHDDVHDDFISLMLSMYSQLVEYLNAQESPRKNILFIPYGLLNKMLAAMVRDIYTTIAQHEDGELIIENVIKNLYDSLKNIEAQKDTMLYINPLKGIVLEILESEDSAKFKKGREDIDEVFEEKL